MIYLTRHGESEWDEDGRYKGNAPVGLSERGRREAKRLAERLANQEISQVITSPTERCLETAQIVADRLDVSLVEDPGLREWEISRKFWGETSLGDKVDDEDWERFRTDPTYKLPAGESLEEVLERTRAALERITADDEGVPLVVGHQITVQVIILESTVGLNFDGGLLMPINSLWIDHCSITTLGEKYGLYRMISMNDTCHLDGQ